VSPRLDVEDDALQVHWQPLLDLLAAVSGMSVALLTRVEGQELSVELATGDDPALSAGRHFHLDIPSYCAHVIRRANGLEVHDASIAPEGIGNPAAAAGYPAYHGLPVRRPDGSVYGTICVLDRRPNAMNEAGRSLIAAVRDLIELHLREQARMTTLLATAQRAREGEEQATQANRVKSELLARVSHELRTPLNAVLGFADLMAADTSEPLGHRQTSRLAHVQSGARHLLALIEDLVDVASIELGKLRVAVEACDLGRLLHDAASPMHVIAQERGVTIGPIPASQINVRTDPKRTRQVLQNLIGNAIKFNLPGRRVEFQLRLEPDFAWLEVRDTGIGMSPGQLQHLFEPFQRLGQEHGMIGGSGLGLALCKEIVGLLRGHLRVTSTPGAGTTLALGLPRWDPTQAKDDTPEATLGNGDLIARA
jgi:signal transduction histidine kinase